MKKAHQLLIQEFYPMDFDAAVEDLKKLISNQVQAGDIVNALSHESGVKERIVAAKILCAFNLHELQLSLVETFCENPERETGICFAKMLMTTTSPLKNTLAKHMKDACPDTESGQQLKRDLNAIFMGFKL